MSGLPRGWVEVALKELAGPLGVFADGDWVESKDQDPSGSVRLIQLADIGDGRYLNKSSRFMTYERAIELGCSFLEAGDVLVSRMADPMGRACIFPGDAKRSVTVVDACIIRPQPSSVHSVWLSHAINTPQFRADVSMKASGTTRARISRSNLGELTLPVPPLAEQHRIVAKLEDLLARSRRAKAALDAIPPLLDKLRQSVLAAAFRGDLTADWRARNPDVEPAEKLLARIRIERRKKWEEAELAKLKAKDKAPGDDRWKAKYVEPEPVDASGLPELPEGWCWADLPLLLSTQRVGMRTGPFGSLLGREDYVAEGVPIFGVESIGAMAFMREHKHHVNEAKAAELAEYAVSSGDILISRSGTVGEVCVVPADAGPGVISTNTMRVVVDQQVVTPDFLGYALTGATALLKQVRALCSGSTRDFLNQSILAQLRVPLAPLDEQACVVGKIRELLEKDSRHVARLVDQLHLHAPTLDRAILAKAFRGELVPQDPNDEPAEVMLARLKADAATPATDSTKPRPPARRRKSTPA